jgi:putative oxidoreductase
VASTAPSTNLRIASWIARVIAAIILIQTLYFKFTGADESVYIFQTVGMEPWGRYGSGGAELIAAGLLLVPATVARRSPGPRRDQRRLVFSRHETGLVVHDDGGVLFALALVVFACCAFVLFVHRRTLPIVGGWLEP